MARRQCRSLQLRPEYKDAAKAALKKLGWTQGRLGMEAQIQSPATTSNFFCSKSIDRGNFNKLCEILSLNPQEVGQEPLQPTPLPIDLNPYIARSGEEAWYGIQMERHSLIRIQAPLQFGKTLLMSKMLDRTEQEGHLALYLTLNGINSSSFRDPQTFFRQFICEIASEIEASSVHLLMPLAEYDQLVKQFDYTKATIKYFEYFLEKISKPFTLAINKLDRLLDNPQNAKTASEFLHLLRFMNEKSKSSKKIWQQFRLILAYSALRFEDSIPLVESQSPFNVGYSIDLCEFSPNEIAELAAKKGLTLDERQIQSLMQSIGGIPNLVQLTLNRLSERGAALLEDSTLLASIYQQHLEMIEEYLRQVDLYLLMCRIATKTVEITELDNKARNSLYRHGLIVTTGDRQVVPRCELYRGYFRQH
ncbi:AAA-like domain-containing protein [Chamaesiphon sp. VAR_48_metabat_135_sub]|uniref:AAA-like domain-containing protein n=1 Tax=Chamaesiphon sp. VAR_48_metabat_135_sub TaxID=2964699 RepID=UPI00286C18CA|nr:AAA-like domain-containing protein [Chamaesiphon sp. VAR_48_metabat_135_sub]